VNGRAAKQLAAAARRMSGQASGYTSRSGYNRQGRPFWTVRRTGYRATYQALKRLYKATPRGRRAEFLSSLDVIGG